MAEWIKNGHVNFKLKHCGGWVVLEINQLC